MRDYKDYPSSSSNNSGSLRGVSIVAGGAALKRQASQVESESAAKKAK